MFLSCSAWAMFPAAGIRALWRQEERQHTDPQEHLIALGSHLKTWEHFRGSNIAEEACLSVAKGQILAVLQLKVFLQGIFPSLPMGALGRDWRPWLSSAKLLAGLCPRTAAWPRTPWRLASSALQTKAPVCLHCQWFLPVLSASQGIVLGQGKPPLPCG